MPIYRHVKARAPNIVEPFEKNNINGVYDKHGM